MIEYIIQRIGPTNVTYLASVDPRVWDGDYRRALRFFLLSEAIRVATYRNGNYAIQAVYLHSPDDPRTVARVQMHYPGEGEEEE